MSPKKQESSAMHSVLGVVIAGGRGTRWQSQDAPFSGGKHLANINGIPLIQIAVNEVFELGADHVIVIASAKTAPIYREILRAEEWGDVEVIIQGGARGAAEALAMAARSDTKGSTAIIARLGDNYFQPGALSATDTSETLKAIGRGEPAGLLFIQHVDNPHKHAIADFDNNGNLQSIVEKPISTNSSVGVAGLYVLPTRETLKSFEVLSYSPRGELEIGTLLGIMIENGVLFSCRKLLPNMLRLSIDTPQLADLADRAERQNPRAPQKTRVQTRPAIYITGIAGFIGSRIAHALIDRGYVVGGVDNFETGYPENLPALPQDALLCADITRRSSIAKTKLHVQRVAERANRELIFVHTACPAYDANSYLFMSHVNKGVVQGTINMLSAVLNQSVARFVNLSSMARYEIINLDLRTGKKGFIGYEEDNMIGGMTPYGVAKVAAEAKVRRGWDRFGIPWTNLVFHNVIGLGQQYDNPLRNVASVMLNLAIHGKAPVIYGDGQQKRSYTPWNDVEEPVMELILDPARRYSGLTVNVGPGSDSAISLLELANLIYKVSGRITRKRITPESRPFIHHHVDERIASMVTAVCSDRRYRMLFGRSPKPDYERILFEMGLVMQAQPREFNYGVMRFADMKLPLFLRTRELRITP